jgi:hypothetical protein
VFVLVVEHRAQVDGGLDGGLGVAEAAFGLVEALVALGDVGGGQCLVGGAEQELAVEEGLPGYGGAVDAQLAAWGGA